jgi:TolA-binding protein
MAGWLGLALLLGPGRVGFAQETKAAAETLDFANRLLRDRRYDLAAEEYESYLKTDPPAGPAADARYGLASARLFSGQYAEARRQFERLLQEAPDHTNAPSARFRVGELAYMLGDLPAARQALETYTRRDEGHRNQETAWTYLGDVCFRLGELAEARRAYEHAIDAFPNGRLRDRSRYGLARTLMAQKEPDAAIPHLEAVIQGGARDWTDKSRYQLGLAQAEAGRHVEAVASFEALEREAPNSPTLPEARLKRAESLGRLDRHAEAEAILKPLAAGEGGIAAQASYALASSQLKQDRPADSLATSDEALTRFAGSPMVPLLLFRSAEAAARLERHDEARARYVRIAEDYPKDEWADVALTRAAEEALRGGDPATARKLAARLPESFPESEQRANAALIEAQAALADKDPESAITRLESLLAEGHPDPATAQSARLSLGVAYRAAGRPDKAAELLKDLEDAPADAQYVVGAGHFEAGRYADAIAPLQAYLAGKPKGELAADALALLALAQDETGDHDQSEATLTRLVEGFPQSKALAKARLRLGEAALHDHRTERALELLRPIADAPEPDPATQPRALWSLGWAWLEAEKPAEAAATFLSLNERYPESPLAADAALARAQALDRAGQTDAALGAYQAVTREDPRGRRGAAASLAQARLLDRDGRHAEAAALFDRYLQDHPEPPAGADPLDGVLAEWGWALLEAGQPDDAGKAFQRLLDQHPDSPRAADARVVLAEQAHNAGELDRAEELLAPVVAEGAQADPSLLQSALFRQGLIRQDRKDWSGAIAFYDRLIQDFPDGPLAPKARFWKAEAALQKGDARTAEATLAALVTGTKPADSDDWLPTARLRHVESLVALDRWSDALAEADALKADRPEFPALHELDFARGRALQGLARFDEARVAYQAVIDARRADDFAARAQLMRGETFFHQKNYHDALKEFLRVVYNYDAPPHQAAALLEAGKVAEQLGKWKDAVDFYERLTSDSEFSEQPSARAAAERLEAVRARLPRNDPAR